MSKSNIISRVSLVVVGVPLLFAVVIYLPFWNHLAVTLVALVFGAGSTLELSRMLEPGAPNGRRAVAIALYLLAPLATYAAAMALGDVSAVVRWLAPMGAAVLAGFIASGIPLAFSRTSARIEASVKAVGANAVYLLYTGAMTSAIVAMLGTPGIAGQLIIWFAIVVFANDSLAWLVGVTIGRHRGISAVSPNKSAEGFIAGFIGSVAAALLGPVLFPAVVPARWGLLACMGAACGVVVIAGDLFESALKRACAVKDSGTIVPGRGGMLDSFDSLIFTAPVFLAFLIAGGMVA